jgi:hypothetical protein
LFKLWTVLSATLSPGGLPLYFWKSTAYLCPSDFSWVVSASCLRFSHHIIEEGFYSGGDDDIELQWLNYHA